MNREKISIIIIVIGLAIVAIISGILLFSSNAGIPGSNLPAASFQNVKDSYPIYKTIPPNTTTEEIKRIGNIFGVSGDVEESVPSIGEVQIVDTMNSPYERLLFYRFSGAFRYDIPDKVYPYSTEIQPDLPSDENAEEIAIRYLLERDLLPDNVHIAGVSIGSRYTHANETTRVEYALTKYVEFIGTIRGIPVYNGGIGVTIGDTGKVVSAGNSLREFEPEPAGYVRIITPEQAYQKLLAYDLVIRPTCEYPCTCNVRNVSLGYWMNMKTEPQDYILPIYVFYCESGEWYVWAAEPSELENVTG